jgi:hypothetical protein
MTLIHGPGFPPEDANSIFQIEGYQGRVDVMAYMAGFILDVGGLPLLGRGIREFYLALLIINSDVLDVFLPSDVIDNLIDVMAGIKHHRIMGAEPDGICQFVGSSHDVFHQFLPIVFDVEVGPCRYAAKQNTSCDYDELGPELVAEANVRLCHT